MHPWVLLVRNDLQWLKHTDTGTQLLDEIDGNMYRLLWSNDIREQFVKFPLREIGSWWLKDKSKPSPPYKVFLFDSNYDGEGGGFTSVSCCVPINKFVAWFFSLVPPSGFIKGILGWGANMESHQFILW